MIIPTTPTFVITEPEAVAALDAAVAANLSRRCIVVAHPDQVVRAVEDLLRIVREGAR